MGAAATSIWAPESMRRCHLKLPGMTCGHSRLGSPLGNPISGSPPPVLVFDSSDPSYLWGRCVVQADILHSSCSLDFSHLPFR